MNQIFFLHRPSATNQQWMRWMSRSELWAMNDLPISFSLCRHFEVNIIANRWQMRSSAQHIKFHIETKVPFDAIFIFDSFFFVLIVVVVGGGLNIFVFIFQSHSFFFYFFCLNDIILYFLALDRPFSSYVLLFISIVHRSCITLLLFPLEFIQTMQARTWSD